MPSGDSPVLFQVPTRDISRRRLRQFARDLQTEIAQGLPFDCLVTSDREMRRLNRLFRRKDHVTDVLSFPCGAGPRPVIDFFYFGEIAISYDRAREQARALAHTTEQELQILMLHGLLHLTGLDHECDRGEMNAAEKRWRKHFDLPAGLIERVHA